jgi:hypothetical protein
VFEPVRDCYPLLMDPANRFIRLFGRCAHPYTRAELERARAIHFGMIAEAEAAGDHNSKRASQLIAWDISLALHYKG